MREPHNPFDASAVRVDAAPARGGAPLGHAPRVVAAALAALLDEAGDGAPRIRARIHRAPRPGANSIPMQLVRRRLLHVACVPCRVRSCLLTSRRRRLQTVFAPRAQRERVRAALNWLPEQGAV